MKVSTKIGIAKKAIDSISKHDDAEAATVTAALDQLSSHIASEKSSMIARRAKLTETELGEKEEQKTDYPKTEAAASKKVK